MVLASEILTLAGTELVEVEEGVAEAEEVGVPVGAGPVAVPLKASTANFEAFAVAPFSWNFTEEELLTPETFTVNVACPEPSRVPPQGPPPCATELEQPVESPRGDWLTVSYETETPEAWKKGTVKVELASEGEFTVK